MTLRLEQTLKPITDEMQALHAAHPNEDLPSEKRARWDELNAKADQVKAAMARQKVIDDIDRRAAGQSIAGGGDRAFETELRGFSVVKAIGGSIGLPGVDDGREREVGRELARRSGRSFQGVAIPLAAIAPPETRVFSTTNPSGGPGSNLIATQLLPPRDHLRPNLVIGSLGPTILTGLVGNIAIPRVKADPTIAWVAEDSPVGLSDPQIDQLGFSPKHAGGRCEFTRNMFLQGSADVEQLLRSLLGKTLAQAADVAAISGTGTGAQPRGILNTSGIGSVAAGTNGGALTYDMVADLVGQVADANAETGHLGFLTNTKVRRSAAKLKDTANNPFGLGTVFQDLPVAYSNLVPSNGTKGTGSNLSSLIYGNWADLIIAIWSEIDVLVNPYESTAFSKGNIQIRVMMSMDIGVLHPESFAAITDLT